MRIPNRVLEKEVGRLPVDTRWEICLEEPTGVRWPGPAEVNAAWLDGSGQRCSAWIGGSSKQANALYDAHLAALGVNPDDTATCAACGDRDVLAVLTVCPACGADPGAETAPCPDCDRDGAEQPTGVQTLFHRSSPHLDTVIPCPTCRSETAVEAPHLLEREADLLKARSWRSSQSAEQNPVPPGIKGDR